MKQYSIDLRQRSYDERLKCLNLWTLEEWRNRQEVFKMYKGFTICCKDVVPPKASAELLLYKGKCMHEFYFYPPTLRSILRHDHYVIYFAAACICTLCGGTEIASTGKCKYGKVKYKAAKCVRVENTSRENSSMATQGWEKASTKNRV